jgi:hypothetical protein
LKRIFALLTSLLLVSTGLSPAYGATVKWQVNQRTLANFSSGASVLSDLQRGQVRAAVEANPDAEKFICTGIRYFSQPMSVNILVRKRAKAACDYAKQLNPNLSTWFQNKPTKARSYAGRVLLTIKSPDSKTSEESLPAIETAPTLLGGFPNVVGDPSVGGSLGLAPATWSGQNNEINHNWFSCPTLGSVQQGGTTVPGGCEQVAQAKTALEVSDQLVGRFIVVQTVVSNAAGTTIVVSVLNIPVAESKQPPSLQYAGGIVGNLLPGRTAFVDEGNWAGTGTISTSTTWFSCPNPSFNIGVGGQVPSTCQLVASNTGTYTISESDRGNYLIAQTRAANATGATTLVRQTSDRVPAAGAAPELRSPGAITGNAQVGSTLRVNQSTWESSPPVSPSFEWLSCSVLPQQTGLAVPVPSFCESTGFRNAIFTVRSADVDKFMIAIERVTNSSGSVSYLHSVRSRVISLAKPPAFLYGGRITGTFVVDQTLRFENGSWSGEGPIDFAHKVFVCSELPLNDLLGDDCNLIASIGSTLSTFSVPARGIGMYVVVEVEARNWVGRSKKLFVSAERLAEIPLAPVMVSAPQIGTPSNTVGESVSVTLGTWSGADRTTYEFKVCIYSDCGDSGITYQTENLILNESMLGKYVQLVETAFSKGGPSRSVVSNSIGPVLGFSAPNAYGAIFSALSHVVNPGDVLPLVGRFSGNPAPSEEVMLYVCDSVPTYRTLGNTFNPDAHSCSQKDPVKSSMGSGEYWNYQVSNDDIGRFVVWRTIATSDLGRAEDADWVLVATPDIVFSGVRDGNISYPGAAVRLDNGSGLSDVRALVCNSRYAGQTEISFATSQEVVEQCEEVESLGPKNVVFMTADMQQNGFGRYIVYTGLWNGNRLWSIPLGPVASGANTSGPVSSRTAPLISGTTVVGSTVIGSDSYQAPDGVAFDFEWHACESYQVAGSVFEGSECEFLSSDTSLAISANLLGKYLAYVRVIRLEGSPEVKLRISSNTSIVR